MCYYYIVEKEVLRYQKVEDVKTEGSFVKNICFKPKRAPLVCFIIGALLLIPNNLVCRILGLFFILMGIVVIKFVKDYKVMDIFDKGVMLYGDMENKYAYFLKFDDIKMWSVKHEDGHDTITFELHDGNKIIKDTFEVDKAYKVLINLIKEKEEKYIIAQENKDKALSIPDAFNNIKKKYMKK